LLSPEEGAPEDATAPQGETADAPKPEEPEQFFTRWNRADKRKNFPRQEKRGVSRSSLSARSNRSPS
jgi:hypothetical protein